ncbi:hypothetical protein RI129_007574 [Pyrocoelia pectoralis]|uniref:4-coumarate--CoA ligase n=1 Tax=Pyrocoelia pectoralis TaxID=417401 RepID=A0AAN7VI04_9COLE
MYFSLKTISALRGNSFFGKGFKYLFVTRYNSGVIRSSFPDIDIPNITIPEYIFRNFTKFPHKIAVECNLTGKRYTFEEVFVKSRNLNRSLRNKLNLKPGDIVALLLPNIPEYPICILGALMANLKVTAMNPNHTPTEISNQLDYVNAKAIVTLTTLTAVVQASIKLANRRMPIIGIKMEETDTIPEGIIDMMEFINTKIDIEDLPPVDTNNTAVLLYSSGTTGLPKGVELTHRNIIANVMQTSGPQIGVCQEATDQNQDVVPAILPIFHVYGMTSLMFLHMYNLCKIVTMPKFTPEHFVQLLINHKPQVLIIVPPIVNLLTNLSSVKKEHLESVRSIYCGGAPLSAQDEDNLSTKIGKKGSVKQGYGLTETSPTIFLSSVRTANLGIRGTVGELVANTSAMLIKYDNPDNVITSPYEHGELLVKGPQVMKGYYNREEENKNAFINGWFKTGDLAYYDENDLFFISERVKELIKVKGYQVSPAELEGVLRQHPDVIEAAVIGVAHNRYGEVPRAYIVPRPNHKVNVDNIQGYLAEKLADYKQLKGGIEILDNIPQSASGKILRKELRKKYIEELQQ